MAKVVVYVVIATAFLFFIVVLSPLLQEKQERKGPGLNRRFGYNIRDRVLNFDPLVIHEIVTESDDHHNGVELVVNYNSSSSSWKDTTTTTNKEDRNNNNKNVNMNTTSLQSQHINEVMEAYQYLTSSGKLNTTLRLSILFPLLDRNPKDYLISYNELEAWIIQQSSDRLDFLTQSELTSKDINGDSSVSFSEHLPHFSDIDIQRKGMRHGEAGWWRQRFDAADLDHNGLLNFTELRDYLHPEDGKNEGILKWLLRDRLQRMDSDNDGKLNFKEFQDHVYTTYMSYKEFENSGHNFPSSHDKFAELDVNKDNFVSAEELLPILHYLYPGEISYAKYYTKYLINEADDNEDGKLSLQEMVDHEYIFYHTVHADGHHDDHDEL